MQNKEQQRQQKLAMISDWQQSSLSQKKYCLQHNIPYHVFHYWYKRCKLQTASLDSEPASFVKLTPSVAAMSVRTELLLPDGRRLIFHQPVGTDFLKALIS